MKKIYKAKLIVFVSPDGGGKTTTIYELKKLISDEYEINERHIRFNNIPRFGQLLFKLTHPFHSGPLFISSKSSINTPIKKHVYGKDIPLWKILIVLAYDTIDYLLGHLSLFTKKNNTVYIFDRYIYDYYTERDWCLTPKWLLRLLIKLIPKPSLIVVLRNDPEVIHRRKAELSIIDIKYTQERIDCLLLRDPNVMDISTCQSSKDIAKEVAIRSGLI